MALIPKSTTVSQKILLKIFWNLYTQVQDNTDLCSAICINHNLFDNIINITPILPCNTALNIEKKPTK